MEIWLNPLSIVSSDIDVVKIVRHTYDCILCSGLAYSQSTVTVHNRTAYRNNTQTGGLGEIEAGRKTRQFDFGPGYRTGTTCKSPLGQNRLWQRQWYVAKLNQVRPRANVDGIQMID